MRERFEQRLFRIFAQAGYSPVQLLTITPEEMVERDLLRQEYVAAYRENLIAQLEHTVIVEPDGTRHRLPKKE